MKAVSPILVRLIASLILLLSFSGISFAQRAMPGRSFVRAELSSTLNTSHGFGGGISYGRHLQSSYWAAGVAMDNRAVRLSVGGLLDYTHYYAYAEWMYMAWTTRTRFMSVYVGGGVFLGYEGYDPYGRLVSYYDHGLGAGMFLYGLRPSVEYSIYAYKDLSAFCRVSFPMHFGSETGWLKYHLGIGCRYDF